MTAKRCSWITGSGPFTNCTGEAEWVYTISRNGLRPAQEWACEAHLPAAEREFPDAMILPLDTENH